MMGLAWTVLLFLGGVSANPQNPSELCIRHVEEWKNVYIEIQNRCSAEAQKTIQKEFLELRMSSKEVTTLQTLDQELKSLKSELLSKVNAVSDAQYEMLMALTPRIDDLAKMLTRNTLYLENIVKCDTWKKKLGNKVLTLTKLSTGMYYYFFEKKVFWQEAHDFCKNHGMTLVSFETKEEIGIVSKAAPFHSWGYWVAASDLDREPGQFYWTDGRVMDRSWFGYAVPDAYGSGKEACLYFYPGEYHLQDWSCRGGVFFVCEVSAEYYQCL